MSNAIKNGEVLYAEPALRVTGGERDGQYTLVCSVFHPRYGWEIMDRKIFDLTADIRHDLIFRQELARDWMLAEGIVAEPPTSRPWGPPTGKERKADRVPAPLMQRLLAWAKTL